MVRPSFDPLTGFLKLLENVKNHPAACATKPCAVPTCASNRWLCSLQSTDPAARATDDSARATDHDSARPTGHTARAAGDDATVRHPAARVAVAGRACRSAVDAETA